jgi:hypothetical protein
MTGGTVLVYDQYPEFVEGKVDEQAIDELKNNSIFVSETTLEDEIKRSYASLFSIEGEDKQLVWSHLREVKNGRI